MEKESSKEKNLCLWKMVEMTDPKYTRSFEYENGKALTTVGAYYQIKIATALWGTYGSTWGFKDINITKYDDTVVYKAVFCYPGGKFEIVNSILLQEKDFAKKLETDTLTKALSRLGFSADIFMGRFDDNKYVQKVRERFNSKTDNQLSPSASSSVADTKEETAPANTNPAPASSATAAQNTETETPDIAAALKQHGLNLIVQNGIYVVQGTKTYAKKGVIKSLGFQYSSEKKAWWKQCSTG